MSTKELPVHTKNKAQQFLRLCGLTVLFVLLADWLFYAQPHGWTIGGFGLLLLGTLWWRERHRPPDNASRWLVFALLLLCESCFEQPHARTIILGLLGLIMLVETRRNGWSPSAAVWLKRYGFWAIATWLALLVDTVAFCQTRPVRDAPARRAWRFAGSWSIPMVLAAMFLGLFAMANPIIANWLAPFWNFVSHWNWPTPDWARIWTWCFIGGGVWALLNQCSNFDATAEETA